MATIYRKRLSVAFTSSRVPGGSLRANDRLGAVDTAHGTLKDVGRDVAYLRWRLNSEGLGRASTAYTERLANYSSAQSRFGYGVHDRNGLLGFHSVGVMCGVTLCEHPTAASLLFGGYFHQDYEGEPEHVLTKFVREQTKEQCEQTIREIESILKQHPDEDSLARIIC